MTKQLGQLRSLGGGDRAMLRWLQNRPDGRAYMGHLLVRLHGLSAAERAEFRKCGGYTERLSEQILSLEVLDFPTASHVTRLTLVGALLAEINRTGAGDEQCPAPLRHWLRYKQGSQEETWGAQVARRYWPRRSRRQGRMRDIFASAVAHLVLSKDLADQLNSRDAPRLLARALVNHVLGESKQKDFKKAPPVTQEFILKLVGAQQQQTIACLRELVAVTISPNERKDAPAKRLKAALTDQFRFIRASRFSSDHRFVKDAGILLPPWREQSMNVKRGDKKQMALLLSEQRGRPGSAERNRRYLRKFAFASKSS